MSAIAKTVWLIESHLFEAVSLDEIAAHAGVSRFHISRTFPAITGQSISGYTRARRLTEAARMLAQGAPDILRVALDTGYGSHEAFTRAFRGEFGITPDDVRRQRSLDDLKLTEPLPMDGIATIKLAAPAFDDHPQMLMAGLKVHQKMSEPNLLPLQWQGFQQHLGHIPGQKGRAAFGIVANVGELGDDYDYFTAVEIDGKGVLPSELTTITIPAQRFARFRHQGHISTIRATIGAIFDNYPFQPGSTSDGTFGFLEYYGPDFDPATGEGTIEIWISSPA